MPDTEPKLVHRARLRLIRAIAATRDTIREETAARQSLEEAIKKSVRAYEAALRQL